ncbi:hypothetical protein BCR44DRAFT_131879 [Catenaria anguillulae PL171]|uniref:Uncharacterized protein n=1 Tax=Catenaria anguillulae PL171 TaxID=765915 RepID=A0A1Y2H6J6_9FUNG|nr:hypothetical protein BCR44DRAFT_131879 [Catenaria anguillulae PL171]
MCVWFPSILTLRGSIMTLSFYDASRTAACRTIWHAWINYRNRRIFSHLKHLLLKSQTTLTLTLLKRLSPQEAHLLKDPVTQARIYTTSSGAMSTQYLSGTHLLLPHTRAARDAWTVMGNARYLRTVVGDDFVLHRRHAHGNRKKVPAPAELELATTPREAIQYLANLDHRSVTLGGRGNAWRVLDGWPIMGRVALYGASDRNVGAAAAGARSPALGVGVEEARRRAQDRIRGRKKLGLAEREKAKRMRQIDKLRQLYLRGDEDDDDDDGEAGMRRDRLDHAVADLVGGESVSGEGKRGAGDDDDFGDLFTWSTGLNIDDYAF